MHRSTEPVNATKAVKARGSHIRVHYKHCREISHAIKGMPLVKAKTYLENVILHKAAIPFTKYTGGIGRHAVGKQYKSPGDKASFPEKATRVFLDLLTNLESNAEVSRLI
jgi:large subunit ribosomal protein L17e